MTTEALVPATGANASAASRPRHARSLVGGRAARVGWVGVITFHLLLMLFGVGFFLWSVPALAVLVVAAVRDWPRLTPTVRRP